MNKHLKNAGFLTGVLVSFLVLLINDEWAKQAYPGWITGKISDFAGLFLFALILRKVFPAHVKLSGILLAGFFFVWKSSLSSSLLATWNESGIWPLERVIDYTDWVAVSIIPLSWLPVFGEKKRMQISLPGYFRSAGIAVFSLLVFCSTSRYKRIPDYEYRTSESIYVDKKFTSSYTKAEILEILKQENIPLILNEDTTRLQISNLVMGSDTVFTMHMFLDARSHKTYVRLQDVTVNIRNVYYSDRVKYMQKVLLMYYRLRLKDS